MSATLSLQLPPELLDEIARRAADLLAQQHAPASPWLTVDEAAEHLRCKRQRVYDLVHDGKIEPARDGRRLLFHRAALDAYLNGVTS